MTAAKQADAADVAAHLRTFTRDGIVSDAQKRALRKAKFIEWHGFWHLSAAGMVEAVRLGYLEDTMTEEKATETRTATKPVEWQTPEALATSLHPHAPDLQGNARHAIRVDRDHLAAWCLQKARGAERAAAAQLEQGNHERAQYCEGQATAFKAMAAMLTTKGT